ncbi:MAG: SbcC/MukB-like Walker B domain-containing protein [Turicibacter sp.]|nr:SbcC/MukB-like Walker B domain-containing protein [Turicibacter sp.]
MKPLLLKITAFGPYAKQTTLNFKEDLVNQEIFVVTGPTGAGKTTIFDAICYALYGETSGGSRTGKELRSDFAAQSDLKTEVEFTFKVKDKIYKIVRAPQQLQKKKRGEGFREVPASVELLEVGSERPPLTKDSEVKEQIQEIIGLKVEQFRKIVMIPQGDFKEFLYANTTNKEEILRKIFGTDFYKSIQEQLTAKSNALKLEVADTQKAILAELKLIKTDEDHVIDIEQPLPTLLDVATSVQKNWRQSIETLSEMIKILDESIQEHRTNYEAGMRLNEKFSQYEQTMHTLNQLKDYERTIKEREQQTQSIKMAQSIIPIENEMLKYEAFKREANSKKHDLEQSLNETEHELILVQKCYDAIESLRERLVSLNEQEIELNRFVDGVTKLEDKRQLLQKLAAEGRLLKEKVEEKKKVLAELKQNVLALDSMMPQLVSSKEQLQTLSFEKEKQQETIEQLQHLILAVTSRDQTQQLIESLQIDYRDVKKESEIKRQAYEHQAELFINAAAIRLANELQVGQACPVCGSCEHPNPRRSQETILTKQELDEFRANVEALETKARQIEQQITALQMKKLQEDQGINQSLKMLKHRLPMDEESEVSRPKLEQVNDQQLITLNELNDSEQALKLEVKRLIEQTQQLTLEKEKISPLEDEILKEDILLQEQRERYKAEERSKQDLESTIPTAYQSMTVLKQMIDEVQEEKIKIEHNITQSEADYQRVINQLTELRAKLFEVNEQLVQYEGQFETISQTFKEQIETSFTNMDHYEEAKQWINQLTQIEQQVQGYYQELHTATRMLELLKVELEGKERVNVSVVEEMLADLECRKVELTKEQATLVANLEQNDYLLRSIKKKYETIQQREQEYLVVGELESLANGRSGEKMSFETYVLSSYFDEVLQAANTRLQKMSSRRYYLLRREEVKGGGRKGLDLDVYDSHTAKNRPVNTLSGGESFKASLALALGLSDTVQQNSGGIQLDTMFIDEGFGTLDSESLDQAIDILMELQDHGRLIGVISHVYELKERIPAKLVVEMDNMGSHAYFKK